MSSQRAEVINEEHRGRVRELLGVRAGVNLLDTADGPARFWDHEFEAEDEPDEANLRAP